MHTSCKAILWSSALVLPANIGPKIISKLPEAQMPARLLGNAASGAEPAAHSCQVLYLNSLDKRIRDSLGLLEVAAEQRCLKTRSQAAVGGVYMLKNSNSRVVRTCAAPSVAAGVAQSVCAPRTSVLRTDTARASGAQFRTPSQDGLCLCSDPLFCCVWMRAAKWQASLLTARELCTRLPENNIRSESSLLCSKLREKCREGASICSFVAVWRCFVLRRAALRILQRRGFLEISLSYSSGWLEIPRPRRTDKWLVQNNCQTEHTRTPRFSLRIWIGLIGLFNFRSAGRRWPSRQTLHSVRPRAKADYERSAYRQQRQGIFGRGYDGHPA